MSRPLDKIRNIGIIAHIDAGKTTVTERMLYYSGAKHRVGSVDSGTTETDDDPEEQDRGITIYSACMTFEWNDAIINLLDTPGHVDFTAEVERCLRVLDGAVVVFSGREGVEAQSETVWRQANRYHVPRIIFINKLDREGADFEAVFEEIGQRLDSNPVALQIPVGQGPAHTNDPLQGVIDLIGMKMLTFSQEDEGKTITESEIPGEHLERARLWREEMLDKLYDFSNEMMELALQEQPIPEELIRATIRNAVNHLQLHPVLCGSALHGVGVQPVLDGVHDYLPTPAEMPPVKGIDPKVKKGEKERTRKPDEKEPTCGLVFKILPAKTGDLYWIRLYSGSLKANSRLVNPRTEDKENISQLWYIHATKREREGRVDAVGAGDIVGVIGPRNAATGDTLCDAKNPILLESITFPQTVISMAIEPESTDDRKKLGETLEMMKRQDPTFQSLENEDTGQTIISGMGELHLEVIKHRLLRDFNLNVKVHKPRVNYRESIGSTVEVTGGCHRQIGGQNLFAEVRLRMEPITDDTPGITVFNESSPEELPPEYADVVREELEALGGGGGLIGGFPLSRIKATILGGAISEENSNEIAFRMAAGDAFERGLQEATPVLLEPIMRLDITTPEEYMGDFVGDLQQRRAVIARTDHRGSDTLIEAHAPLAEMFGYSSAMRSISQGRAGSSMEPLHFAPSPPEVAEKFKV